MLKRKLFRDIKQNKTQFLTIFLMVLIGVMVYTGIEAYMDGMKNTSDIFYSENNLQDLNVMGPNFTNDDLKTIKEIKHVKNAERKLSITGKMESKQDKTLLINFIESNEISKFYVDKGNGFDKEKSGVWVDTFYAAENNLNVGDKIKITYDGFTLEEKIIGTIYVPDNVYTIKDESELYPDHENFGFVYLSINEFPEDYIKKEVMSSMEITDETLFDTLVPDFNYKDYLTFTSVMVDVDNKDNNNSVKNEIEDKVKNALAITNIEDSYSYRQYQGEIEEGETYIGVFSGLFLFIAILSVITTMTRVVKNQRVQIGTLKALGFKNSRVYMHYIGYGFWVSLVASILGVILGRLLIGNLFIGMEMAFFEIPNGHAVIRSDSYIVAILVIIAVSLITYLTCRKQLKENPAETLRVQMPVVKKNSLNFTNKKIFRKLSFSNKWNLRDVIRNKIRTITGIAGVTGCTMLIVCAFGMFDSLNHFIDLQFSKLYNFDYKLTLKEGINDNELKIIEDKYGNLTSESLGIEIKVDNQRVSNNIFVTDAKDYVRFVDKKENFVNVNSDKGIYMTYKLAKKYGYELGDKVQWHIYGDDKYYTSEIVGFNKDPQNQNMTMTRKYLESLGIKYKPDSLYTDKDLKNVKTIKNVEVISNVDSLAESLNNMLSTMKTMLVLIIGIAILLGAVIIYNLGILSFSEKQYQFATLKVLGFKDKQIEKIFIKQNNWISIISIIFGLPLGFYLTDWLFKTAIEETYDFGANIKIATYIYAIVGVYVVSYLVSKFLARKIKKIDMVSSLKGNE